MSKKSLIPILIFCVLMFNVSASFLGRSITPEDYESVSMSQVTSFTEELFYSEVWDSYDVGLLGLDTVLDLTGVLPGSELVDLEKMDLYELERLKDLQRYIKYDGFYDFDTLDEYITTRQLSLNNSQDEFLVYAESKQLLKTNINSVWVHIISFTQIFIEILNIFIYLLSLYLIVYVIIQAVPDGLCFMRDKLLERAVKRGGKK